MDTPLLDVESLSITFRTPTGNVTPVPEASFHINAGERVAIVGESGCGKSVTALAITGLPPCDRADRKGRITFQGQDLLAGGKSLRDVRRHGIAYVFQDPMASLNPVLRISTQMAENLPPNLPRAVRKQRILALLNDVGLPSPERIYAAYPCELSGGQCQRVMLAMALASEPKLLIADEPTTALDVTTQRLILELMVALAKARGMALLLITHNLGIVSAYMQRLYVMYAGRVVESGAVQAVLHAPKHPYTRGLLAAVPSLHLDKPVLQDIPGTVPPAGKFPPGCTFAPRCAQATPECTERVPPLLADTEGRMCRCLHCNMN